MALTQLDVCHAFRGQISMGCVENLGLATAFRHTVNGRSYLEVHHRAPGSKALQILSLKANHPDDAAQWLQDMRQKQQVIMHATSMLIQCCAACTVCFDKVTYECLATAKQKSCQGVWQLQNKANVIVIL